MTERLRLCETRRSTPHDAETSDSSNLKHDRRRSSCAVLANRSLLPPRLAVAFRSRMQRSNCQPTERDKVPQVHAAFSSRQTIPARDALSHQLMARASFPPGTPAAAWSQKSTLHGSTMFQHVLPETRSSWIGSRTVCGHAGIEHAPRLFMAHPGVATIARPTR